MTNTATTTTGPALLKVKDVAAMLNIGVRTAYELVERGELGTVAIGAPGSKRPALRVPRASVDAYLARLVANSQ